MGCTPLHVSYGGLRALKFPAPGRTPRSTTIWLHGIGERGNDVSLVANFGLPAALSAGRAVATCDVICPQLPAGEAWRPALVRSLAYAVRADYESVVLMGYSLGGSGVLDTVAQYGAVCALHVAIASADPPPPTANPAGMHLIAIQGEHDFRPRVSEFVKRIRERGGLAEESIVPDADHYISELALWQPELQQALKAVGVGLVPA